MKIAITNALKKLLDAAGPDDAAELADAFLDWKLSGDEYGSYYFGKDGGYIAPKVNEEKYLLQHVHLVPLTDHQALERWNRDDERGSRKKSNRVLVYVGTKKKDSFLLIYVLNEPDAHEIAQMKTERHRQIMHGFAKVAEKFLDTGEVIG